MRRRDIYNRIVIGIAVCSLGIINVNPTQESLTKVYPMTSISSEESDVTSDIGSNDEIEVLDDIESGQSAANKTGTVIGNNVNIRSGPNTTYGVVMAGSTGIKLSTGAAVTILGTESSTNASYPTWYKISFTYSNATYTGYIASSYITINSTGTTTGGTPSSDADFEAKLTAQGFPESYKVYLRQLHEKYPNWEFNAIKTGLDWNTVIENERSKSGQVKNLVQGTSSAPHYNWRSTAAGYTWATDTWYPYDGTSWFAVSDDLLKYYMDPRTYLSDTYIYCFESLTYMDGVQTQDGVEAILAGSFMAKANAAGGTDSYSKIMMQAGKDSNVSPYHIASRIKQEIGTAVSASVTGTNTTYPNIYNFYNIGANDTSGGGAVLNGLKWAATGNTYLRPWNTPYKSITGGAMYIGEKYILVGQNTLYTQKFNVTYKNSLYSHQYMSNVQAPSTEAAKLATAYKSNGLTSNKLSFSIPVYNNMPSTACAKPADSGNPNNWLKTLNVTGYSLTPSFGVNAVNDYSLIVPYTTTSIQISGTTVNANAKTTGIGTYDLNEGNNNITIKVTAQNGNVRTYNLTVVRIKADGTTGGNNTTDGNVTFNTSYNVGNSAITGVAVETGAANLVANLGINGSTAKVYMADGVTEQTGNVGTGNIVKVTNGKTTTSYTVTIYGDINGDGAISSADLLQLKKQLAGATSLSGAYLNAADIDKNGGVSSADLLQLKKHLVGASNIKQ